MENIILYAVVFLILGSLKHKSDLKRREVSEVESGKRNSLEDVIEGRFVIEHESGIKIIIFIGVIFCGIMFVIGMGTYIGVWDIFKGVNLGSVTAWGIFLVLMFALFLFLMTWKITVDKDTIFYRNYFFATKQYKFSDLDNVIVKKNNNIIAYREGKRIFSIEIILRLGPYFLYQAKKYNVKIE